MKDSTLLLAFITLIIIGLFGFITTYAYTVPDLKPTSAVYVETTIIWHTDPIKKLDNIESFPVFESYDSDHARQLTGKEDTSVDSASERKHKKLPLIFKLRYLDMINNLKEYPELSDD